MIQNERIEDLYMGKSLYLKERRFFYMSIRKFAGPVYAGVCFFF